MTEEAFSRTVAVLGSQKTEKLKNSHVLIAGLGGVGGYALEALSRMGIGRFTLVDSDVFEQSNLNRQLLCTEENIGKSKVLAAKDRIMSINSNALVSTYELFIDSSNIEGLLNSKPDVVIDAIDSISSKCLLLAKCMENGIKVVSSMGAALRTDPTKIKVADISETHTCPLAKAVRTGLKDYNITTGIPCVFSTEKAIQKKSQTLGSLPTVVGVFGLTLASVAVTLL